ncbi:MAG: class I SAM-dependent methyltransferase [Nitrospirae bacterium]|nr:class I SAM-dependent methyltransferase [Nitrospirota bacterium]
MGALRESVLRRIRPLHRKLRNQKVDLFFKLTGGQPAGSLLDVGGGAGIAGEFLKLYSLFGEVTVVNLQAVKLDLPGHSQLRTVVADGCNLPFAEREFDWVFSNAVVEHVGEWERQKAFAEEVRRVARKGYFVTTPNKYFPIEPHTLLRCYQFFPVSWQKRMARFSPGYLQQWEEIRLLSARQLHELFPEADVCSCGFPLWGNSLVAFYRS